MRRQVEDIPFLLGGLGMFFNEGFTMKVVYPKSVAPLLDPNLLKENGKFDIAFCDENLDQ